VGRLFLVALLALVAGVGIVALIETEPGYLLIAYGGYTVESSFWVGIVLIAALVLALYATVRFLHRLFSSPASMLSWASERRLRQSSRLTSRGLVNFIEGNWSSARRQLLRGARHSEAPLLNYLIAARSSYRLQDPDAMRSQLASAAETDLDAGIAVDLTQAEMQLHAAQYEEALATLVRAGKNAGRHPYVLHLLCRAHEGLGDVEAVTELLPDLRKHRLRPAQEIDALEVRVHRTLMTQAVEDDDGALLQALWKKAPARLREEPGAHVRYLEGLLACGETSLVEKAVVKILRKRWDSALVRLYGHIPRESAQKPLATAEGWLKQRPDDPDVLLCLGRLALQERLWQRAREYLERSHKLRPSEEVCLELGRLLAAAGEHAAASAAFFTGAQLRAEQLPELPQPDDVLPGNHRLEEGV
jgi:HemY protein